MFPTATVILTLCALLATSLAYRVPEKYIVSDDYMENIAEMCERTQGLVRSPSEIYACNLYDDLKRNKNKWPLDIDNFQLPISLE